MNRAVSGPDDELFVFDAVRIDEQFRVAVDNACGKNDALVLRDVQGVCRIGSEVFVREKKYGVTLIHCP